jgi:activating signal cointegrator complex subunit 3
MASPHALTSGWSSSINDLQSFHHTITSKITEFHKQLAQDDSNQSNRKINLPTESFLWQDYIKDLPLRHVNDKALQAQFARLQNLVHNWCSEDALRYLGSFVSLVYHNVGPVDTLSESKAIRSQLELTLGPIDLPKWNEIYDLAKHLHQTRSAALSQNVSSDRSSSPSILLDAYGERVTSVILSQQQQTQSLQVELAMTNISHQPQLIKTISALEANCIQLAEISPSIVTKLTQPSAHSSLTPILISTIQQPFSVPSTTSATLTHPGLFSHPLPDIFAFALESNQSNLFDNSSSTPTTHPPSSSSSPIGSYFWVFDNITAATGSLESDLLTQNTIAMMASERTDDELQGDLLDLLGFDAFDLIGLLLVNRGKIIQEKQSPSNAATNSTQKQSLSTLTRSQLQQQERLLQRFHRMSSRKQPKQQSDPHIINRKKGNYRDIEKDFAHHDKLIGLLSKYRQHGVSIEQLHHTNQQAIAARALSKIPHIRINDKTLNYEEIIVPPQPREQLPTDDLIQINKHFHPLLVPAFGRITHLNTLQTKVFPSAYQTNANMLVCAPTGAGKTNVALMTVLQQISQHIIDYDEGSGTIDKSQFKIIYVAPMKALAAEIAGKFSRALAPLGLSVRELTGDMQLTKKEIMDTQLIVTTPEKWDVITRKSNDGSLLSLVKLLIIDEIHLLHEDRGPVLETIVARTHRNIETSQLLCRIVGLSATLPNYRDVAQFLAVADQHLHFFDSRYRPIPLQQHFIGVKASNPMERISFMNEICYKRTLDSLKQLNQAMVFVHSRRDTVKTAQYLISTARRSKFDLGFFDVSEVPGQVQAYNEFNKICNSNEIRELVRFGIGVHHAGLTRAERSWMEKAFTKGFLSVLVSTSTLAWGVNLPAHTVIINGTQLYDSKRGGFVDLGMSDIQQAFGRAGRVDFDTSGEAILITTLDKLGHYISLLTAALPIESQMIKSLPDHLNAEIILGTVTNLREADTWLTYTYLYTRMLRNPTHYGVSLQMRDSDPMLHLQRRTFITQAVKLLMQSKMVKFDISSGNFYPTDIGRVASLYYIHHKSIEVYNELLKTYMTDEQIFHLISHSKEFENLRVRDEEIQELTKLIADVCLYKPLGGLDSYVGKANILLQCYISGYIPQSSTLQSDQYFIQQSADRVIRALFEMVLRRGKAALSAKLLDFCKMINHRLWPHQHILRQFIPSGLLTTHNIMELERARLDVEDLLDLTPHDLCSMITISPAHAKSVLRCARNVPWLHLATTVQPLTRDVLRINIDITCQFEWNPQVHGDNQYWWIWIESPEDEQILHHEQWICTKQMATQNQHFLSFTIPISEPLPTQYILKAMNDTWIGSSQAETVSFHDILLPQKEPVHPELLPLQPIPTTALRNPRAIELFKRFTHFNPVQTQAFHTLYHTDYNVFLGAPTGSGKTVICELAILRALSTQPNRKIIYIAPMKALVRERYLDWSSQKSFAGLFGCSVLELTGDTNPEIAELNNADIVITSPEKIDGLTRSWQTRDYIKNTALVIIDEIHLLGQDRGPVLEVLVSRLRYIAALREQLSSKSTSTISSKPGKPGQNNDSSFNVRFIGLSTAMSNANDVADWLNIPPQGLFNFHPSVRPVPLTTYVAGFPGKAYCPRNATMNKPCYAAITTHSPHKPVIIFVTSRRQTRLTALDLISLSAADGKPKQWLHMDEDDMELIISTQVSDNILKHCLSFGVGLHHAGLIPSDREVVEKLFLEQKIQILLATSTVAWGLNFPAYLSIVKDCSYYDTKTFKYVQTSLTDVLQCLGRAGRPQFDQEAKGVVFCQDSQKPFYQKFLHSPFPIESSLHKYLHNHLNAEIAQGSIQTLNDAVEWLSWTFLFRRLLANPTYYGLPASSSSDLSVINEYILRLLHRTIDDLVQAACVTATISESGVIVLQPTSLGQLSALYYIDYRTAKIYWEALHQNINIEEILALVSNSQEFWEVPVRHNEDQLNTELIKDLHFPLNPALCGNPHIKTNILFQARLLQLPLPISDYQTDTQSVLAQSARMFSCLIELCAQTMWFKATVNLIYFLQMTIQGHFLYHQCEFNNLFILVNSLLSFVPNSNHHEDSAVVSKDTRRQNNSSVFSVHIQDALLTLWQSAGFSHLVQFLDLTLDQFLSLCNPTPSQISPQSHILDKKTLSLLGSIPLKSLKQLYNVIQTLPKIDLNIEGQNDALVDSPFQLQVELPHQCSDYSSQDVIASDISPQDHLLIPIVINLRRLNHWDSNKKVTSSSQQPAKILGPHDVKTTKEGWFLLLSTPTTHKSPIETDSNPLPLDLLLAHKHISIGMHTTSVELLIDVASIQLLQPNFTGFQPGTSQNLLLTLLSDCYIGFDQQYEVIVHFNAPSS